MKKKSKLLFLSLVLVIVGACKREIENPAQTIPRYADAGDGGLDVLGYGYDIVNGTFASSESATRRVIDVRKLYAEKPSQVDIRREFAVNYKSTGEENYEKYLKHFKIEPKISGGLKIFGLSLFESEFKSKFDQTTINESNRSFSKVDMIVKTKSLEILSDGIKFDYLKNYLDPNFVNDCNRLSAEQLVSIYGLGVIRKMTLGGKLTAHYSSIINGEDKKTIVQAGGKAAFKFIFKVDVDIDSHYEQQDVYKNTNQKMVYQSRGGTGAIGLTTANLSQVSSFNPGTWSSTVNEANSVLIDFSNDSFIFLNELIPNKQKASEVSILILKKLGILNLSSLSNNASPIIGNTANGYKNTLIDLPFHYGGKEMWYKFNATSTAHTISLENVKFTGLQYGSSTSGIALYDSNLKRISYSTNNNITSNLLTPGETYFIRLYISTASEANNLQTFSYTISSKSTPENAITSIERNGYIFKINYLKSSNIPASDIKFEWAVSPGHLSTPNYWTNPYEKSDSYIFTEPEDPEEDVTVRLRVRMVRASTNQIMTDWYYYSQLIWL